MRVSEVLREVHGMENDPLDKYPAMMTAGQVAEYLGTTVKLLAQWRTRGSGPPWTKVTPGKAGLVRYPREDLRAFIRSNTTPRPTTESVVA
jgi:Helix-turn-helix domain